MLLLSWWTFNALENPCKHTQVIGLLHHKQQCFGITVVCLSSHICFYPLKILIGISEECLTSFFPQYNLCANAIQAFERLPCYPTEYTDTAHCERRNILSHRTQLLWLVLHPTNVHIVFRAYCIQYMTKGMVNSKLDGGPMENHTSFWLMCLVSGTVC